MRSKWRIQLQAGVGLDQLPGWAGVRVVSAEAPAPDCLDVVVEGDGSDLERLVAAWHRWFAWCERQE
jgi:hypothetical protein